MILVDTSVWIDHLRSSDEQLANLLVAGQVAIHPMVMGELACGNLKNRAQVMGLLHNLPVVSEASHKEALYCLEQHALMGRGIGFVDLHLLASVLLTPNTLLWTRDRRLNAMATDLNVCWFESH